MIRIAAALMLFLLFVGCAPARTTPPALPPTSAPSAAIPVPVTVPAVADTPVPAQKPTRTAKPIAQVDAYAFEQNKRLGRGINFGNALEGPTEGEWGVTLQEEFFPIIHQGGFQSIRVPIRWNAHTQDDPPYTIDPAFFERIDWVVENAVKNDLVVVLDLHHYTEMMEEYSKHEARFLAIWEQIAKHYQSAPDSVYFELMNEPNGSISSTNAWNELVAKTIPIIRATNPNRTIIVGPGNWYNITDLFRLQLPEDDRNLIASFHYYQPFKFTHQGAEWQSGSDAWLGTIWKGSVAEKAAIWADLDLALSWSKLYRRPLYMGEFGAYSKADMPSRARWTAFMARSAEERGMSWAYWEFGAGFGAYDRSLKAWVDPLHKALIP